MIYWILNKWYNLKLWWYLWQEERDLKYSKSQIKRINIVQEQTKELYLQGISKIKKTVNKLATNKTEYEKTLGSINELLQLAINREDKEGIEFIENLKKVYIFKSECPKEVMIETRIKHFDE